MVVSLFVQADATRYGIHYWGTRLQHIAAKQINTEKISDFYLIERITSIKGHALSRIYHFSIPIDAAGALEVIPNAAL